MRLTFILLALFSTPALGYCVTPSVPYSLKAPDAPSSYDRPSVPYCLNGFSYSRQHTCDRWELDRYFSDVEDYVSSLQTYLDDFNDYTRKVSRLALEAEAYAICEAEEATTQHK